DLSKFQMLFWTIVAIVAFLGELQGTLQSTPPTLPDISSLFLVLMGLAQGTYVGTKLVTTDTPRLTGITPGEVMVGATVKLVRAALGNTQNGSQIVVGQTPLTAPPLDWKDTEVSFAAPRDRMGTMDVKLVVSGRETNAQQLTVVPLRIEAPSPKAG